MTIALNQLIKELEQLLVTQPIKDYCPNGLQVTGKQIIKKIVTGVTACELLIKAAIEANADMILTHHGLFWQGDSMRIEGFLHQRLQLLLSHSISLVSYHLPLDIHPSLGNNIALAKVLNIQDYYPIEEIQPLGICYAGKLATPISSSSFAKHITNSLNRTPTHIPSTKENIQTIAWCTGAGQKFISQVYKQADAYITGEISEATVHIAREVNIDFFAAGHHATERYGIKSLGEYIQKHFNINVQFIDIDNPA